MGIIVKNGVEYGASVDLSSLQSAYSKAQVNAIVADVDITPTESAHSAGDYLIVNGVFLKALRAIASGESLVIGTNVDDTTIGYELKALLARIASIETRLGALEAGGGSSQSGTGGSTVTSMSVENDILITSNTTVNNDILETSGLTVNANDLIA